MLEGVDTRRLTRHLRERGAMRGVDRRRAASPAAELTAQLLASPSMDGLDLASRATVRERRTEGEGPHVVAYDYGMKRNIVRMLVQRAAGSPSCRRTPRAAQVRELKPDGLFLSNGPGDPAAVGYAHREHPRARRMRASRRSGSASGISSSASPSGATPRSCPTGTAAVIIRCAISARVRFSSPRKTMASR